MSLYNGNVQFILGLLEVPLINVLDDLRETFFRPVTSNNGVSEVLHFIWFRPMRFRPLWSDFSFFSRSSSNNSFIGHFFFFIMIYRYLFSRDFLT